MLSFKDLTIHFGTSLNDKAFQQFLAANFTDLSAYDIFYGYIASDLSAIEFGFKNDTAVYDDDTEEVFEKGDPVFSHFNLYPNSAGVITQLPLDIAFTDTRSEILKKTAAPLLTKKGFNEMLDINYINDSYKIGDIAITVEYNPSTERITLIQIRDNNAAASHLKLL